MQLQIKNLNKSYSKKQVLFDIDLNANAGRSLGLLGRNGHGKTTIMKIIMGIIYADSGQITLNGNPLKKQNVNLGYLPEERGLYQRVAIIDQMIYFAKLGGMGAKPAKKAAQDLLEQLGIKDLAKKKLLTLSKGNQQKVQLAIAMLNNPDILILDEPFSGLDPINSRSMQDIIKLAAKNGKIIIFSGHQMGQIEEFCQDIAIIKYGRVMLSGNLDEIKNSYPKDKLLVSCSPNNRGNLDKFFAKKPQGISNYEKSNQGYIIHLKKESDKAAIMQEISQFEIDSISVIKPGLLDIFLEMAGEECL